MSGWEAIPLDPDCAPRMPKNIAAGQANAAANKMSVVSGMPAASSAVAAASTPAPHSHLRLILTAATL